MEVHPICWLVIVKQQGEWVVRRWLHSLTAAGLVSSIQRIASTSVSGAGVDVVNPASAAPGIVRVASPQAHWLRPEYSGVPSTRHYH